MKKRKIALLVCCIGAVAALLLPSMAYAATYVDYTDADANTIETLPPPYRYALCLYNMPSISFLYYRTDTGVRANSLPLALTFAVIQIDEDGDGYFDAVRPHIIVGGDDYAESENISSVILNINDYDFPPGMTADYYVCISDRIPAYYNATNSSDFIPRFNSGELLYSYTLPALTFHNSTRFDTFSIKNELVAANMEDYNVPETEGGVSVSTGYVKGLTTIQLYNKEDRKDNPDSYNRWEFKYFSGVVPTLYDATEKIYYISTQDYDTGYNTGYSEGYDTGYSEGYDTGEFSGYYNGIHNGREQGYEEGYKEGYAGGYDGGYIDGQLGSQGGIKGAKAIFGVVWDILSTDILGFISVADILIIVISLGIMFFFLRIARGG